MSAHPRTAADAAGDIRLALADVADALVRLDHDAMLDAETALGRALTGLGNVTAPGDRAAAGAALGQARAELLRCRRLGASFSSVSRALLRLTQPASDAYTREGVYVDHRGGTVSVRARV